MEEARCPTAMGWMVGICRLYLENSSKLCDTHHKKHIYMYPKKACQPVSYNFHLDLLLLLPQPADVLHQWPLGKSQSDIKHTRSSNHMSQRPWSSPIENISRIMPKSLSHKTVSLSISISPNPQSPTPPPKKTKKSILTQNTSQQHATPTNSPPPDPREQSPAPKQPQPPNQETFPSNDNAPNTISMANPPSDQLPVCEDNYYLALLRMPH